MAVINMTTASEIKRWVVDYSENVNPKKFEPYDLVILDSGVSFELKYLQEENKETLGYLSIGEVSSKREYFNYVKSKDLLLGENPNWQGSYVVDIRKREWVELVINRLIPQILFKRFNGLMLDTVDQAVALEHQDPEKYGGMKNAAIHLIRAIRHHYPNIVLMMNRGYDILPETALDLNIVLGESVYTKYNFQLKKYEKVTDEDYDWQVNKLKEAKRQNPLIEVFTLDYWDPNDTDFIKEIYKIERENGFVPYVSTVDLQKVMDEP